MQYTVTIAMHEHTEPFYSQLILLPPATLIHGSKYSLLNHIFTAKGYNYPGTRLHMQYNVTIAMHE